MLIHCYFRGRVHTTFFCSISAVSRSFLTALPPTSDPFIPLLDAPSHLYKRLCPFVRPSVRPSVRRSVPCYLRRWKVRILGASCAVYLALFFLIHYFYSEAVAQNLHPTPANTLLLLVLLLFPLLLPLSRWVVRFWWSYLAMEEGGKKTSSRTNFTADWWRSRAFEHGLVYTPLSLCTNWRHWGSIWNYGIAETTANPRKSAAAFTEIPPANQFCFQEAWIYFFPWNALMKGSAVFFTSRCRPFGTLMKAAFSFFFF